MVNSCYPSRRCGVVELPMAFGSKGDSQPRFDSSLVQDARRNLATRPPGPNGARAKKRSMVATLSVRCMALPELVIQSPQIGSIFVCIFPKKNKIARRREWFSGVFFRAFLWFASGPSKSPSPCSQCCVVFPICHTWQKRFFASPLLGLVVNWDG